MNEHTLTDTEREALWTAHTVKGPHFDRIIAAVERIVAARVAEAVDRERAAWATKIETLAGIWEADDTEHLDRFGQHLMGGSVLSCSEHLRGLLAADDTEGKRRRPRAYLHEPCDSLVAETWWRESGGSCEACEWVTSEGWTPLYDTEGKP